MRLGQKKANAVRTPRTLERKTQSLYADDADGLERDVLNRKRLATQLARAIRDLAEETESAVVGLVGPWGSGKSSLLGQIETDLANNDWYMGHHNPWAYSDFAGSAAGFFASLRDAVPEDVLGKEWRAIVGEWVSKAAPLGAAGGVAGVDGSGAIGAVGAVITGDRSPARLRESAAEGLGKIDHPVLMVLDDLDRLAPDELLYTFKLVRLLGRLPNVYYLLAYDEATLTFWRRPISSGGGRAALSSTWRRSSRSALRSLPCCRSNRPHWPTRRSMRSAQGEESRSRPARTDGCSESGKTAWRSTWTNPGQ